MSLFPLLAACHIAVMADAVTKVSHFSNAAQSTRHVPAVLSTHYGLANKQVQEMHESGCCNLQSFLGGWGAEGLFNGQILKCACIPSSMT